MGKALPCDICHDDSKLTFKHYSDKEYWVNCDRCGRIGPVKSSPSEAGDAWNEEMGKSKENVVK